MQDIYVPQNFSGRLGMVNTTTFVRSLVVATDAQTWRSSGLSGSVQIASLYLQQGPLCQWKTQ